MRTRGSKLQLESLRLAHMPRVYQALNILGNVPWCINHVVHDTVLKAWEQGGGFAELPALANLPEPQAPDTSGLEETDRKLAMKRFGMTMARVRQ